MKFRISIFSLLFSVLLHANVINIAVAANMGYAIEELTSSFKSIHPDIETRITLSGSAKLTAQIRYGAPYHLLMSADMFYPQSLYSEGLTVGEPRIYAEGALALLSVHEHNLSRGLNLLLDDRIHKIAIANPKTAPYGRASFEALEHRGLLGDIESKFVYGESISQTMLYATKAADIGLVSLSSLYAPQMKKYKKGINWIVIPRNLYAPINQGIVLLASARKNKEAKLFYDFIFSAEARSIFEKYGYTVP